ncbi:TRAP transporter substrate-binding protein [Ferrovibrio sp.]|uniref:TRAP transporter substrate-binding protein n=1 Tax=Ferrovibrio sp. TaxID=1917215 RepID=UPI00263245BD|nr:TRAP transporter substrate-binding protein [Ferrovibrio sp.]
MRNNLKAMLARAIVAIASGAALFVTVPAPHVAAQDIELKLSHFLPPGHGIHRDWLLPWGEELAKRSNGKVKVTIFPAGSAFGNPARQLEQAVSGVVDIAHGLRGVPAGRFNRMGIIEFPFLVETSNAASRTLWEMYPKHFAQEFPDTVKVLGLHAHNAGLIHTRDKQVKGMDDLKGLRIRSPSPQINAMLQQLGATPVGLPPGEVYENLQRGVIDGAVFPWDPINSFRLFEVTKYHLDARSYTASFYFVMNKRKYDSLPAEVKKAIDETTGAALTEKFGDWWNQWDAPGLEAANRKGNVMSSLSEAERNRWRDALKPTTEKLLTDLEGQGVKNAREIYREMQQRIAKYEGGKR